MAGRRGWRVSWRGLWGSWRGLGRGGFRSRWVDANVVVVFVGVIDVIVLMGLLDWPVMVRIWFHSNWEYVDVYIRLSVAVALYLHYNVFDPTSSNASLSENLLHSYAINTFLSSVTAPSIILIDLSWAFIADYHWAVEFIYWTAIIKILSTQ